jgi:N-acetylmuramoyl-L-alanine amidase
MNFSKKKKLIKLFSLITVLVLMTSLFTGCKKDTAIPETTEGELNLNIDLAPESPTETTEAPTEPVETAPPVNEKSATVTSQLNVRSLPTTQNGDKGILGTLYAGDKVIVERREESSGIQWAYISSPMAGWICMDFVEMDVPDAENNNNSTPAGNNPENQGNNTASSEQPAATATVKGVVTTGLNIRKEASTTSAIVGSYSKGDVITILETANGWGRTSKGWIKMQYVNVTGNTTGMECSHGKLCTRFTD